MKVIFLDIDGVLNGSRTCLALGGYPMSFEDDMDKFDKVAIAALRNFCLAVDIKMVLASAWRIHYTAEQAANALDLPIIDRTPSLPTKRGEEIKAWLDAHPEVERYAILDDDPDMLGEQLRFFTQTDHREGLQYADLLSLANTFDVQLWDCAPRRRTEVLAV